MKTNTIRNNEEIEYICQTLQNGFRHYEALEVTLDEFKRIYTYMVHLRNCAPHVSLVYLETIVVAQFSEFSPQHFNILCRNELLESDFDFILNRTWYGPPKPSPSFLNFIAQEIKLSWRFLVLVFIISGLFLYLINNDQFYELIGSFLIQSGTIFLSLYIIFTVSQSKNLSQDVSLFKAGIIHKYYSDDKNITFLGIITIAITFIGMSLVFLLTKYEIQYTFTWITTISPIVKAIIMGIAITLLFYMFFTVATYYLERNRDVIERDLVVNILDKEYKNKNKLNK